MERQVISIVLFAIFLTLYLLTLLENTLIISLVCSPAKPSTCASHLIVVDIFCSVVLFTYYRPSRVEPTDLNKLLSVIYTRRVSSARTDISCS
ncbi:hypothetical protein J1605_002806 [Eschrichtius robustus]|uniref:Uncharacterized protein n=1 Tax=Eschrichtius robustus TaxID=9764 RepID=A0AB34HVS5_ESCRO|nr:hypothetical protein J1605_002806 [Eschrichtius robustus]